MDLGTTYLGKRLPNPFVIGAGPLGDELDTARALEDAGASMIVLRSLFEEEITGEQMNAFFYLDGNNDSFSEAGSFEPEPEQSLGPDEYLEHLRLVKKAIRIPVIASLNGVTPGGWTSYARLLEQAGADGMELHLFHAASDMTMSAADVEKGFVDIVREVKRTVKIPVAVKLAPLFTAFANFAKHLDAAGADALVLFTRFHKVDIDVEEFEVLRSVQLSDSSELALRLRGAAALAGRIKAAVAVSGGVHTGLDVIKATMTGAHVTQLVSAILRHGPGHLGTIRREIESWMQEHEWASLDEMRGNMSFDRIPDPAAYERANFRMALK
jgi:dihydroorotate dehydrogenase (fumarate)